MPEYVKYMLSKKYVTDCKEAAKIYVISRNSRIWAKDSKETEYARRYEDQLTGQLGQLAATCYLTGSNEEWVKTVENTRSRKANSDHRGDGGQDILGTNIDIKSSMMRGSKNPLWYRLAIAPAEFHRDWIYVCALIPEVDDEGTKVYLMGWAPSDMFGKPEWVKGWTKPSHVLPTKNLKTLPNKLEDFEGFRCDLSY